MTTVLYTLLFVILGTILGSFFNVVAIRMPKGESFISNERSKCPQCGHTLGAFELVPVLSYLVQGGKCVHCKAQVSMQYPVSELLTGFLFGAAYLTFGMTPELVIAILFISMLVIVFIADIKYLIIPNKVLLFFLPLFIIGRIIVPLDPWWSPAAAALIGLVGIMLIIILSKGGMGAGDMKLFFVMGIVLGLSDLILTFVLSVIFGLGVGLVLMALGHVKKKTPFPFGPSIVVAALVAYFWGDVFTGWYLGLF